MSDEKSDEHSATPRDGVPSALLENLHQANKQFHVARKHVEQSHEALINPTEERERASAEVRDAEQAVEAAEGKIKEQMQKK